VGRGDAEQLMASQGKRLVSGSRYPNYERFWTGESWGEQRYWGGAGGDSRNHPLVDPGTDGNPVVEQFGSDAFAKVAGGTSIGAPPSRGLGPQGDHLWLVLRCCS
jgi:hypothetical protein